MRSVHVNFGSCRFLLCSTSAKCFWRNRSESLSVVCAADIERLTRTKNASCIGFIDGTFRPDARPKEGQQSCYNWHYRGHGFKFLSMSCPDGLTQFYFGPVQGRRHNSFVLSLSDLDNKLTALNNHHYADQGLGQDNLKEGPWEAKSKVNAWGTIAMQLNLQGYAQGYLKGARALERWFNSLMSIDLQQFLGTWKRSGEGDGGPPPDEPEDIAKVFTSLKGRVDAGKKSTQGVKNKEAAEFNRSRGDRREREVGGLVPGI